jgi:hypothetical protein
MSVIERIPACPICGEPAIRVKGDYFRCSDHECGTIWNAPGWDKIIQEEKDRLSESDKLIGINGVLVIYDELLCDKCGRIMKHAEKYCYNSNELIDSDDYLRSGKRGTRYCTKCSLLAGYMRMVRNVKTGKEYAVMFRVADEEYID